MKIVLGALLLIIGIVCIVLCIYFGKDIDTYTFKKEPKKVKITLCTFIVSCICCLGACSLLGAFGSSPSENREKEQTKQKIDACLQRSDTYYKCSWSSLENRCVCKQR